MRLQKHVKQEDFHENKYHDKHLFQRSIYPEETIELGHANVFHLMGSPESADGEASSPAKVHENFGEAGYLLGGSGFKDLLDSDLNQLHDEVFFLLFDFLADSFVVEGEVEGTFLDDDRQGVLLGVEEPVFDVVDLRFEAFQVEFSQLVFPVSRQLFDFTFHEGHKGYTEKYLSQSSPYFLPTIMFLLFAQGRQRGVL